MTVGLTVTDMWAGKRPASASVAEEAAFWDAHDTSEFEDEFEPVRLGVSPEARHRSAARRKKLQARSSVLDKYQDLTRIEVRIMGDYLSYREFAPLLDDLGEHFFTVRGSRDNVRDQSTLSNFKWRSATASWIPTHAFCSTTRQTTHYRGCSPNGTQVTSFDVWDDRRQ